MINTSTLLWSFRFDTWGSEDNHYYWQFKYSTRAVLTFL